MEELIGEFITICIFLFILSVTIGIGRPIIVFFHELGHALPALLFTRQKVTIYLGSYGDPANSWSFRIGLLEVWLKYNFLTWKSGLCIPSKALTSKIYNLIFIISGPIVSFCIALLGFYFVLAFDLHGTIKLTLFFLVVLAFIDLIMNLYPLKTPIKLFDGTITFNDGQQLLMELGLPTIGTKIELAFRLVLKEDYLSATTLLEDVLEKCPQEDLYRVMVCALLQSEQYQKALFYNQEFEKQFSLNSDDYSNSGLAKARLKLYEESIPDYNKALDLNPDNMIALNNRGFTLNMLTRFEEAITDFDKAILLDQEAAYAFNNRGLAKIKTGHPEEGLKDIFHSINLDAGNAYAYRSLGIYHLDRQEFDLALGNFRKAKDLDATTVDIDSLIELADQPA